ncbi:uncharacterized protein LOC128464555 [Spea bombifrons]|uniref:uncharacterized protein LOC128464555 n=1 Tax=Spea bombifrons TaxID=233779 RepID=UPI00234A0C03|nr:uncharacterized protein LOC128464555 [Spea bombifrons]
MATNLLTPKGKGRARRACEDSSAPRSIRFSFEENTILVSKVCEYFHSIIGPAANETPQRKKNEIWKKIVDAVNEVGGNNRPDMVVKKRYFDVKRQLKKKLCKAASHLAGTEDDKPEDVELTSYEEELLEVLMPRNEASVDRIVDTDAPRFSGTPTSSKEKNVLRRKITDAIRAVDGNNRLARKRYFLAKKQLKTKLSMTASHSGQTGSEKFEDEDLTSDEEELLEALGLDIVTGVDGSVDTDQRAFLQEQTCALHQTEEEQISSGPPISSQDQEPKQMSSHMKSMGKVNASTIVLLLMYACSVNFI